MNRMVSDAGSSARLRWAVVSVVAMVSLSTWIFTDPAPQVYAQNGDAAAQADDPQTPGKVTVTPVGIEVTLPVDAVAYPGLEDSLEQFNAVTPATRLHLLFIAPEDAGIVRIETEASLIESFTDDLETRLLPEQPIEANPLQISPLSHLVQFPPISPDQRTALVTVASYRAPAKFSRFLNASGTIRLRLGRGQNTHELTVPLEPGALDIPDAQLSIRQARPFSRTKTLIELEAKGEDIDRWSSVEFFVDGEAVPVSDRRVNVMLGGEQEFKRVTYLFDAQLSEVTLKIRMWDTVETVDVPVDVRLGIGG